MTSLGSEGQGSDSRATKRALPKGGLELREKLSEVNYLAPNSTATKEQGGDERYHSLNSWCSLPSQG